jgi:hypothetical protein
MAGLSLLSADFTHIFAALLFETASMEVPPTIPFLMKFLLFMFTLSFFCYIFPRDIDIPSCYKPLRITKSSPSDFKTLQKLPFPRNWI